jgi:endonuclease/exonuclease/phosphatase (EEP) superfamily protein YafD
LGKNRPPSRLHSVVCGILGGLTAVLLVTRLIAGLLPTSVEQTALDGLDYLPPWWLVGLVVPVGLWCLWVERRGIAALLKVLFLALLGLEDDWRWRGAGIVPIEAPSFTVVALNVRNYVAGHTKVVEGIKSLDPDVALLSENHVDAAGKEELRTAFAPYTFVSGRSGEAAIASRLPILDATEVDFPSRAPTLRRPNRLEEQVHHPHRSFMHVRVDIYGSPVNVLSIRLIAGRPASNALADQLAWGRYLHTTQREEVRFLFDYLSRLRGPVVLGGDFNAPPSSRLIREISAFATDAYLASHRVGLPTFPAKFPAMRLDYLFSMNGVVPADASRPDLRVSDHYPILARFYVPANEEPGLTPWEAPSGS